MELMELIIDLKNEISVERRDVKEKSDGFDRVIDNFLIQFYLRKKGLKLKDELRSGFTIGDGDRKKVFLSGV